jgi:hypothetical protein
VANLRKHRVDFREAATVLNDPLSTTFPDPDHSSHELRFLTVLQGCRAASGSWSSHAPKRAKQCGSSAPDEQQHAMNEGSMKKNNRNDTRAEYDFSSMKGGVRGKYAARYRAGTNLVLLDPEVAQAFPTDAAVNQTLRAVLDMANEVRLPSRVRTAGGRGRRRRGVPAERRSVRG